ncbi:hypothetical protein [Pseudanabaena minima]|uniref:hypothetical protein n=1 Tax=Pseudanabaena minima TaxID=890415 RepID=UPI003DAA3FE4
MIKTCYKQRSLIIKEINLAIAIYPFLLFCVLVPLVSALNPSCQTQLHRINAIAINLN